MVNHCAVMLIEITNKCRDTASRCVICWCHVLKMQQKEKQALALVVRTTTMTRMQICEMIFPNLMLYSEQTHSGNWSHCKKFDEEKKSVISGHVSILILDRQWKISLHFFHDWQTSQNRTILRTSWLKFSRSGMKVFTVTAPKIIYKICAQFNWPSYDKFN